MTGGYRSSFGFSFFSFFFSFYLVKRNNYFKQQMTVVDQGNVLSFSQAYRVKLHVSYHTLFAKTSVHGGIICNVVNIHCIVFSKITIDLVFIFQATALVFNPFPIVDSLPADSASSLSSKVNASSTQIANYKKPRTVR